MSVRLGISKIPVSERDFTPLVIRFVLAFERPRREGFRVQPTVDQTPSKTSPKQAAGLRYCRSYSPLLTRLRTVKPAFLASVTERGFSFVGVLKPEMIFRTAFLQAGHFVSSGALSGRRRVNLPPHAEQLPSQ